MSDLIRIVDLEVWTCIGVPDEERAHPQRLLLTLEMRVKSFVPAAETDNVAHSIDYAEVANHLKVFAETRPHRLLETFAEELARDLLGAFPIRKIRLELKKFVLRNAAYVSIQIERKARAKKKGPRLSGDL